MDSSSVSQSPSALSIDWNIFVDIMQDEGMENDQAKKVKEFTQDFFANLQASVSTNNSQIFEEKKIYQLINGQNLGLGSQAFILTALFKLDQKIVNLFDKVIDLNAKGAKGESLLHCIDDKDLSLFLINQKVDVNSCDQENNTPLHNAALAGEKEIIRLLLENGADIHKRNSNGASPLLMAAHKGNIECLELLLQKGSCLNDTDHKHRSALHYAAANGQQQMVEYLLSKKMNINSLDIQKKTILHYSKVLKNPIFLESLLSKGIFPNIKNDSGQTALFVAVGSENISSIITLLNHGANINASDDESVTVLHLAANKGLENIVKLLIAKKAKVNLQDIRGWTPLDYAIEFGFESIVKELLDNGANMDLCEKENGDTPLHKAIDENQLSIANLLLERGANPNLKNHKGKTALFYALKKNNSQAAKALIDKGADILVTDCKGVSILHLAASKGMLDILELYLKKGGDINVTCKKKQTALHYAAADSKEESIKFLINRGANINCIDDKGFTPATYAYMHGNYTLAKELHNLLDSNYQAWIDHRMLAHRIGISIYVKELMGKGQEISLGGFLHAITFSNLLQSVKRTKKWLDKAPKDWKEEDTLEIFQILDQACTLLDQSKGKLQDKVEQILKLHDKENIVIIPTGFAKHGTVAGIFKDRFFKGDRSNSEPGITHHKIRASNEKIEKVVLQLISKVGTIENQEYISKKVDVILDLERLTYIKRPIQPGETCSWTSSAKLAFQISLFAKLIKKGMSETEAKQYSSAMYHAWAEEDREHAVQDYLETVPNSWVKTQVLACVYRHLYNKGIRKGHSQDPILKLIESKAPLAVKVAEFVEISNDYKREAQVNWANLSEKWNS